MKSERDADDLPISSAQFILEFYRQTVFTSAWRAAQEHEQLYFVSKYGDNV
jgi:hypothetical protein